MKWYLKVLKENYADFNGRARRKEYWMFLLFNYVAMIVATIIDSIIGFPLFLLVIALGTIVPSIALVVRRMHDLDKSGWFALVGLIPLIGGIWLFVLLVTEGTKGSNQYGEDPKNETAEANAELLDA